MEKGNEKSLQNQWVECEDDTCASSISNVSDPNKVRRKREHKVSKARSGGIPYYVGDGDAKEPSDLYEEIIRGIKLRSSSPPPNDIDPVPSVIIPRERTSQSPDHRSGSSSRHDKVPPQGHRRASVETPRIRSRRASIGGTTFYKTSHMAKIDSFLRGSELRLNKNGTCSFIFEEKKFEIETTAETKEFMFYCSLGGLDKLKKAWAHQTYFDISVTPLLHMMALWNEEQITKCERDGNSQASRGSVEEEADIGLLRIDSSEEHPVVALILYGHVDNIKNATHFQDKLDEFVDDALKFHDLLKAGPEKEEKEKEKEQIRHCKSQSFNTNTHRTSFTSSLTSAAAETYSVVNDAIAIASSESEGLNVASSTHVNRRESSTERATPALTDSNDVSHGQDDYASSKKSGLFSKMIKSLRSKQKEDIGKLAFVDPSNQSSAFVVDTRAANAVKINISRQSSRKESSPTDDRHQARSRRGSSHTNEIQNKSHAKRASTIDDGHRVHPKKGSSFNIDDRHRGPTRKSASFFHDDFSGGIYYPVQKGASYRVEEKRSLSEHTPRHSHSDRRVSSPEVLNDTSCSMSRRDRGRSGFTKSEPALAQDRVEMTNHSSAEYRRHQANDQQRAIRNSSRPRRKVHHNQLSSVGGKEEETSRSRSRQASLPPGIGRSSRRSKSALRKAVRKRSKSELRCE